MIVSNVWRWTWSAGNQGVNNLMAGLAATSEGDQMSGQGHGVDDGHSHGLSARAAWLLVLPVVAMLVVAPPALGAFTAERRPATTAPPSWNASPPALPAGDPVALPLNDYASRAVWDEGRTLVGRTVTLTGFVSRAPGGGWYLTRLALTCCAADATVTKIDVVDGGLTPSVNTWLTVTGTWVPGGGTMSETAIPRLKASHAVVVEPPANPYE